MASEYHKFEIHFGRRPSQTVVKMDGLEIKGVRGVQVGTDMFGVATLMLTVVPEEVNIVSEISTTGTFLLRERVEDEPVYLHDWSAKGPGSDAGIADA